MAAFLLLYIKTLVLIYQSIYIYIHIYIYIFYKQVDNCLFFLIIPLQNLLTSIYIYILYIYPIRFYLIFKK